MTITLAFAWWTIPTIMSVLWALWVLFWPLDDDYLGIGKFFFGAIGLFVCNIAWMVAAILK